MTPVATDPLISFVVPLYRTGSGIERLFDAFRELPTSERYELVLVDDGSDDGTLSRARALLTTMPVPVTLVDLARNFGEHAAVLEGFRHVRGRYVINLDDDLQNPVDEALRLLDHLRRTDADVVYSYFEDKKHHWFRNLGSRLANAAATWMLDKPPGLYLSSFRCMKRELTDRLVRYVGPYPHIDGLILGSTNRIERLLVRHDERADGRSGYTLRKLVRLGTNMFFNFSVMPLRLASLMGAALCLAGLLMLGVVLVEHLVAPRQQVGWGSLMSAITIFSGSQLLMLGVIGEYVGRSYMTLAGKPQSLVREVARHEPAAAPGGQTVGGAPVVPAFARRG